MEGLRKNNPSRGTDTAKHRGRHLHAWTLVASPPTTTKGPTHDLRADPDTSEAVVSTSTLCPRPRGPLRSQPVILTLWGPPLPPPPLVPMCTPRHTVLHSLPLSSVSPGGLGPSTTYSSNSPASPLSSASLTSPLSPFSMVSGSQGSPTKPGSSEVSWENSTGSWGGAGRPDPDHTVSPPLPQGPHPSIWVHGI